MCQVVIVPFDGLCDPILSAALMRQNPTPSCMKYRCDSATRGVIAQRDMQLGSISAVGEETSDRLNDSFSLYELPRALLLEILCSTIVPVDREWGSSSQS